MQRIFYASSGASDLISAHESWRDQKPDPREVSVTFSSQVQEFCARAGADALLVSPSTDGRRLTDGRFQLEHIGKNRNACGIRYHGEQIKYGLRLLRRARRFRADLAIIDSGATHYFVLLGFRLLRIPVVTVLHNALWPKGFRPRGTVARAIEALDTLFWRWGPKAVVVVSPECARQVRSRAPRADYPVVQTRAQFFRDYFEDIAQPPPHEQRPFRVVFAGRLTADKGGLDVAKMARFLEDKAPGLVHWTLCGDGPDADNLRDLIRDLGIESAVDFRGWISPAEMKVAVGASHACIVPTRGEVAEGLAMTAVEAILSGRPLVTNSVVPALELLRPACLEAEPNDVESHASAVLALATDKNLYDRLRAGCSTVGGEFLDRSCGLAASLKRVAADRQVERAVTTLGV